MRESLVFLVNRPFAHYCAKNEGFAQKTDERIPSPAGGGIRIPASPPLLIQYGIGGGGKTQVAQYQYRQVSDVHCTVELEIQYVLPSNLAGKS